LELAKEFVHMTNEEYEKYKKEKRQGLLPHQIRSFYYETIRDLKNTVSHSRKGKPQKKPWGMHLEKE